MKRSTSPSTEAACGRARREATQWKSQNAEVASNIGEDNPAAEPTSPALLKQASTDQTEQPIEAAAAPPRGHCPPTQRLYRHSGSSASGRGTERSCTIMTMLSTRCGKIPTR